MGLFSFLSRWFCKKPEKRDGWSRRALMAGINAYQGAPLSGCVNDVETMRSLLKTPAYGFSDGDMRVLKDGEADTSSILDGLRWLASAGPNTLVYFHFSGHGTQVPTGDPGEPDGLAEVICPSDFDWSPDKMITDKQMFDTLSKLPPSVVFNWTSDSCHSGGLERSLLFNPYRPRTMSMPDGMVALIKRARAKRAMKKRGIVNGSLDVGFASACRSDQTASDTFIDGKPCGAMTYYFAQALRTMPRGASLSDIISETRKNLSRNGYAQVPQAEGARAGKPFLA
jgi:hypothetical protein